MSEPNTHPLMPGVRCAEVRNPDWPRTLHDRQLTGFSPLTCGMAGPPEIRAVFPAGGELGWLEPVVTAAGEPAFLVGDGRLRFVTADGAVRWTSEARGSLHFFGDLRGTGRDCLLLGSGPDLSLLDAETGRVDWTHRFEPPHVQVRTAVGRVFPDHSGMDVAVFLAYGETGCLIHFPPEGDPEFVWERVVVPPGEHPERADHGCSIRFDLSDPGRPLLWNVRHHRCRGFDARTGETVSSLLYDIGGGHRRNYGPWDFGRDEAGRLLACVVAERVQTHVHAVRLNPDGPGELAWQHYYGELYVVPGVVVERIAVADLDGDGCTEIAYNVRDPERDFRAFVRVRNAGTGAVEVELADAWCIGWFTGLGASGATGLLVLPAPDRATPLQGPLTVYTFTGPGTLEPLAVFENAGAWGPVSLSGAEGNDLFLRHIDATGRAALVRHALCGGGLHSVARTEADALLEAPVRAVFQSSGGETACLVAGAGGTLNAVTWEGRLVWGLDLNGGAPPTLSAADLDGDGRAELVAATAGNRVRVLSLSGGSLREIRSHEFHGSRNRHSPLLYDLEGDGRLCLLAPGCTSGGHIAVRAFRSDGGLLWETDLGVSTAAGGAAVAWNAGDFLPGPRAAVAVSVANAPRDVEGTFLLDGPTGELRWFKGIHGEGDRVRPYLPNGIPTAFDFDGDGVEEIGMDLLSYMAFLKGEDGGFACLYPTPNIRRENALYAGLLYNSFCPLYRTPDAREPHWFVPLGHGSFGLCDPEPTTGVWREEVGYDLPPRVGLVDVDGDGVLEVGYALLHHATFRCRDLWTGAVKWELELPEAPDSPVLAADVDGDGKGEFLTGRFCIGTNAEGGGEIRWEFPVPIGWAAIADFDGDGMGEIACVGGGNVYIFGGQRGGLG